MVQASVYGKCILTDYNAVHKDMCAAEFLRLKDCYLVSFGSVCTRDQVAVLVWID